MLTLFKTPSGALVNLNYVCAIDYVNGYGVRGTLHTAAITDVLFQPK